MDTGKLLYCNPLSLPSIPLGSDGWEAMEEFTGEPEREYRSVSDPSVRYFDGKWYMYPSYGMAWVSEDFRTWKHVRTEPYDMKYSPDVVFFRNKYYMTSHSNGLYVSDTPLGDFKYLGDFIMPDGSPFRPTDPCLFADDDGRLYMYAFTMRRDGPGSPFTTGTMGMELDGDDPRRIVNGPETLFEFDPANPWERFGEKRQDARFGWIEGQWMLKRNGRYYLIYSSAGTQFTNYCMAAYYSDEGPLSGFKLQKNNPVTESRSRLISGAGHGSITEGPDGTLWAFYTMSANVTHAFERLVGMDLIAVNGDGELYAPHGITDTPQYAPGQAADPVITNSPGLYSLTSRQRTMSRASSHIYGREPMYALDESLLTFWEPGHSDPKPCLTVNLQAPYIISAARVIWYDIGLDSKNGAHRGPFRYRIECAEDLGNPVWRTVVDATENTDDLKVDFRQFPETRATVVRLTVTGHPYGVFPAVTDFSVFGTRE
ncbi:MAG: family 43 glycosylhydrolase [Clostridia bacterium]|nr:family 43 glycosylhydrolase [Clostridia bacterium]